MIEITGSVTVTLSTVVSGAIGKVDNTTVFEPSNTFEDGFYKVLGKLTVAIGRLDYCMTIVLKRLRQAIAKRDQPSLKFVPTGNRDGRQAGQIRGQDSTSR